MLQENQPRQKILISVNANQEDVDYLKSQGINRSSFLRQAVKAHKEGTFIYDPMYKK